jgi:hypothetical protein
MRTVEPAGTQGPSGLVLRSPTMSNTGVDLGAAMRRPAAAIGVPGLRAGSATA